MYEEFFIPLCLWRWNRQSVPKRRHINSRRRVITRKKAYNIQNTAKAWNLCTVFLDRRFSEWLVTCYLLFTVYSHVSQFFFRICVCHPHVALGWGLSHYQTRVAGVRYPGTPSSGALFKKFGLFLNAPRFTVCPCMSVSGCSSECTQCSQCSQPAQMSREYDRDKLKMG